MRFYSPLGGGVKTYVRHKMRAGPRLGHEIIVLVPSIQPGVEIVGPGARDRICRRQTVPAR
jgi:alpha-1,6-mannosyltransferase